MAEKERSGIAAVLIRPIEPGDDAAMAAVIRAVMPEFGACGPGFAIEDPEVDSLSKAYEASRHAYFVALLGGRLVGGAGVGPLAGGDGETCELRKMYLLDSARGRGLGQGLLDRCLGTARTLGFRRCYLETLAGMKSARVLYEKNGFEPVGKPLGSTGHSGCDRWYVREL